MVIRGDQIFCQQQRPTSLNIGGEDYLCWSRIQTEAGQPLEAIIARKERERRLGSGLFMWGVGNAPATIANRLARTQVPVPVVFSIMKSRPKKADVTPQRIFGWRQYIDAEGVERSLPRHSLVTSRGDSRTGAKRVHYALMCWSDVPLQLKTLGESFSHLSYRNASGKGSPVGFSQVTALLKRVNDDYQDTTDYQVNLRAWLTGSYWVRLTDPVQINWAEFDRLVSGDEMTDCEWLDFVEGVLSGPAVASSENLETSLLI